MSRDPHRNAAYWVHSDPGIAPAVSDADPCPGRCNAHWRQAVNLGKDTDDLPDPVPGQPIWCRDCQDDIRQALHRLPDLAAAVYSRTDGRLNTGADTGDRTRHGNRTGSPSGSPAWDTVDETIRWACSWEDALRQHLGHASLETADRRLLTGATQYLANHVTAWLCWDDVAVDAGHETFRTVRELERAAGRDVLRHRLPAPCLSCDRRALVREDGSETVECGFCHRRWSWDDYQRLAVEFGRGVRMGSITA